MHTIFKPSPADFDRSYTATCKSSIDDYILKLMEACDQTGDGALKAAGASSGILVTWRTSPSLSGS